MKNFSDYYNEEFSRRQEPRKRNASAKPTQKHREKIKYNRKIKGNYDDYADFN